jgi:hypothetical protein
MVVFCATLAQAKPNFSGRWKINTSKSEFGEIPTPASHAEQITHNDPNLKVVTTQAGEMGEFTLEYTYTTDGKECINKFRGIDRKSTAKWEGDSLVIESRMDVEGNAVTVTEKWVLSQDGKTLTVHRHLKGPEGETDVKTVLEKQ